MVNFKSSVSELVEEIKTISVDVIVKTYSGAGNIIAELIDQSNVGNTIAGDNTILVIGIKEAGKIKTLAGI